MNLNTPWRKDKLEHINACPFCGHTESDLAYDQVEDWSFYASPGYWSYWNCRSCSTLYLNPRPKESYIHEAYGVYYTHLESKGSWLSQFKTRLKNEFFSHLFQINLQPRIGLPKKLSFLVKPLKAFLYVPFGMEQLVELPRGKLLDVGCGNGHMLKIAKDLGWEITGIEIDSQAVQAARSLDLNVFEGSYLALFELNDMYDCIICSHVLEHVYQPFDMLDLMINRLKPGGTLILSCPNALSHMRAKFGINWRGIEAPRHIAIPALPLIESYFKHKNFQRIEQQPIYYGTYVESDRIKSRKSTINLSHFILIKFKLLFAKKPDRNNSDYIQIVATK